MKIKKLLTLSVMGLFSATVLTGCMFGSSPRLPDPVVDMDATSGMPAAPIDLGVSDVTDEVGTKLPEIGLDTLFDEQSGYHFSNLQWGYTPKELAEVLGTDLGKASALGMDGGYLFIPPEFKVVILGHEPTDITFSFPEEDELKTAFAAFQLGDYTTADLDGMYEEFISAFKELYGEPSEMGEQDTPTGLTETVHSKYMYWHYDLSETNRTSLQVATSDRGKGTEAVIVGFTTYDPVAAAAEEAED